MHEAADLFTCKFICLSNYFHAFHNSGGLVVQRGGQLIYHQCAGLLVNGADIGVGTAHVNTDANGLLFHKLLLNRYTRVSKVIFSIHLTYHKVKDIIGYIIINTSL